MEMKTCRFCGESQIPIDEDICASCDAILNSTSSKRPPNPYDSDEPIEECDEEGGL